MRYKSNEQGHGARAQGSSPALCRGPRAMDEWAWAKARHGSRVWAASELRHNAHCLARSERKLACHECYAQHRSLARSERCCACNERCAQRWAAAACSCVERWRAQRAPARVMPCDGEQQRCDAAHGLRAHGQRWLCACGPWACVAWGCCVAIGSF